MKNKSKVLDELMERIKIKKNSSPITSYTASLFKKGNEKIANKFGEEAFETVTAFLSQGRNEIVEETADLIFHLFILLEKADVSPDEVWDVLKKRMKN